MKSLNMVYALKNGKTVHISEVVSGEKCGCICPACGEIMIAKKGSKVIHHFAHKSTIECEYGYQTSLHLAAKEIISKSKHICLPALYLTFSGSGRKMLLMDAQSVCVFDVILEWGIHVWGTVVAVVGLVPICLAYPLYKQIFGSRKKKYGAEIIRLSDEILNEEK